MVFEHSVKVPTQYKKAAAIFRKALNEKKALKTLLFEEKHARISSLYGLFHSYSENRAAIENAIETTNLLTDNPRLDPSLGRVLVTELLFGSRKLNGQEAKPIAYVLSYETKLKEAIESTENSTSSKTVTKPRYVRVNTNATTMGKILKELEKDVWTKKNVSCEKYDEYLEAIKNLESREFIVDIHVPTLLVFSSMQKRYWATHKWTLAKKVLLQDRATSIASQLLNPPPNSVVLDMCASPGMKTIHLSNIMENQGTIYAVEQSPQRYETLCKMVEEAQATCVKPVNKDVLTIDNEEVPGVEYILVDPSCSGSGIQNRMSLYEESKDRDRVRKLRAIQVKILTHALTAFPNVKRIVYSTCSIYAEENEQVIQRCMELNPNFKLLNGKKCLNRKWNNVGDTKYKGIGKNCLYARPDQDLTDGFFMAVLERVQDE